GLPMPHRNFGLLDEQSFAADLAQVPVEYPVASRRGRHQFYGPDLRQAAQLVGHVTCLPQCQFALARCDAYAQGHVPLMRRRTSGRCRRLTISPASSESLPRLEGAWSDFSRRPRSWTSVLPSGFLRRVSILSTATSALRWMRTKPSANSSSRDF